MYLNGCVSCLPVPSAVNYWPSLHSEAVGGIFKKGPSFNIAEILHPNSGTVTHPYSTPVFTYGVARQASPPPPPNSSGLAPLQALCASGVSAFRSRGTESGERSRLSQSVPSSQLKFGISRILSEEFGKIKKEKENNLHYRSPPPVSSPRHTICPCNSITCNTFAHLSYPSSLSAVHALQPPHYPMGGGTDSLPEHLLSVDTSTFFLPGPYSVLSAENGSSTQPKRKRSWSRAVFSNLQRKGLEKRFEVQKYVTKPDRRQLAAMLGLTDAQVKVWFQNRRMKWRHAQQQKDKDEQKKNGEDKQEEETDKPADDSEGHTNEVKLEVDIDSEESDQSDMDEEISIESVPEDDTGNVCADNQ